eukprot:COSAG01_NODE_4909_length_4634_cov_25.764498_6_plen_76_part_01
MGSPVPRGAAAVRVARREAPAMAAAVVCVILYSRSPMLRESARRRHPTPVGQVRRQRSEGLAKTALSEVSRLRVAL